MVNKIVIGGTERGMLFRNRQFYKILLPGTYWYAMKLRGYTLTVVDLGKELSLSAQDARAIIAVRGEEFLARYVDIVKVQAREVALVVTEGTIKNILLPEETKYYWKGVWQTTIERYDISNEFQVSDDVLRRLSSIEALSSGKKIGDYLVKYEISDQFTGYLMVDGKRTKELSAGTYGFWKVQRNISVQIVDSRLQAVEISGQELLTKDKVTIRLNLSATYRLIEPLKALTGISDSSEYVYRELQLALRSAVGQKTLDELLETKEYLGSAILNDVRASLTPYGYSFERIGVKDVILPGEIRAIFNKVVEAEKAALAQNIKRREETAATRSLGNTARMMEGNPVLLRLKELEVLEKVSEKIEKLTVFDGLEGVLKGLVTLPFGQQK